MGAPGDDQGARRRPATSARLRVRQRRGPVRLPERLAARRDRRRPPHEGPPRGVHPPARQGVDRGQARPRRHPRRGVRRPAAADRARPADPTLRSPNTLAALARARRRGLRRRGRRRTRSPTPTGSCAGSSTGCRSCATCRPTTCRPTAHARTHDRALARPRPTPTRSAERVRPHDRARALDPRAAVLPAAARGVRRAGAAPAGRRPHRHRRNCWAGSGSPSPRAPTRCSRGSSTRRPGSARCWRTSFPVMAPALAIAADPDAALVRLERVAEAVGERGGARRRPRDRPERGVPARARWSAASRSRPTCLVADPERIRALADGVVHADDAQADLVRGGRAVRRRANSARAPPAPRSPPSATACSARRSTRPRRPCRSP